MKVKNLENSMWFKMLAETESSTIHFYTHKNSLFDWI